MTELKSRSVEEILIALIDGLTGFPFPHTQIHHCVVHVVRQSLGYVPHCERKVVALELKGIHQTLTEAAAETETEAEAALWGV